MDSEKIYLNFPSCIEQEFPHEFSSAFQAVEQILKVITNKNFSSLEKKSPALKDNDWENYLKCSLIRVVHSLQILTNLGFKSGHILDLGSYFGNFSIPFAEKGFQVDACDSYSDYIEALDGVVKLLQQFGINILDFQDVGYDLGGIEPQTYDVVLCMGVIEHIPHTPRILLESIDRVLKPDGILVIDTPNLSYVYNRRKIMRGESALTPIEFQYNTELPFQGHHREYTINEIGWLLSQINQKILDYRLFNYSYYGIDYISGYDLENYKLMQKYPELREYILVVSQKNKHDDCYAENRRIIQNIDNFDYYSFYSEMLFKQKQKEEEMLFKQKQKEEEINKEMGALLFELNDIKEKNVFQLFRFLYQLEVKAQKINQFINQLIKG
ncbi:MAG: methyltransferase domain-containing protein [Symploca sp. SIO2D2]|nr:methyltransferase domain-containing protein [Symploca sp. SIO2D2]